MVLFCYSIEFLWLLQIFDKEAKDLEREVCFIDIASDEIPERYYKESEVRDNLIVKWWRRECKRPQESLDRNQNNLILVQNLAGQ